MNRRTPLVVALISASLIALEMIWTRLFSAEFYYTFAFLTLSLAILGLGLGALAVRMVPGLADSDSLGPLLSFTGLAALAGPPLVFRLGLDFSGLFASWRMAGTFVLTLALLAAAFFFGGAALAIVFRGGHRDMPRLYMADLLGAGTGVVVSVLLMNTFGTPAATALSAAPVLLAALLATPGLRRALPVALLGAMVVTAHLAPGMLELARPERAPVIYRHWDAMAKVKMYDFEGRYRSLNIDNLANTGNHRFDGNWDRPEAERFAFGIDVGNLIARFDGCRFLSLGSGAGQDVLQALQYGAAEVHAVEVNPHINRMLRDGDPDGYLPTAPVPGDAEAGAADRGRPLTMAEFTGHIYRDPRVIVASEDARAYVGRFRNHFDVIYSLSSNTFAALASGSFALAESYLFTTEAFRDYWRALASDGFMMMEHQFYVPRLVGSLLDALRAEGVADPTAHFAVYDLPKMRRKMILLSRRPLTDEIRATAFGPLSAESFDDIHLLFPAPEGLEDNLVARIVRDGWEAAADTAPVDISPTTDDRPFAGQMGLWRNLSSEGMSNLRMLEVFGFPLSKLLIVTILAVVLVLLVPVNLLPYLGRGPKLGAVPWLYFFAIGAAFMAVEVVLIQQYTLFVGPSVYSIGTILLALLLASGAGARFAARVGDRLPFLGIAAWLVLDVVALPHLTAALSSLPVGARMAVTALLVAPLGFCMGMPFPKAALRVGELVDWGFAVNGAASVFGATGILLIAFTWGFGAALLTGAAVYMVALVLLSVRSRWPAGQVPAA